MSYVPPAQDHLEFQAIPWVPVEDDVYYGGPIESGKHASAHPKDYPDVYVNGEDVTVTIDPLKNAQWILPGTSARHSFMVHRGKLKDHAGVLRVQHLIDKHEPAPRNFEPTYRMLDNSLKYSSRCVVNSSRGSIGPLNVYDTMKAGTLPVISEGIYNNVFRDTPDYRVWDDVHLSDTHASRNRAFDCSSWPFTDCR